MTRKKNNFPQINFYCDESCYIQKDGNSVMALASVFCATSRLKKIKKEIKKIKLEHGFSDDFEIKWTKLGAKTVNLYKDIIKYVASDDSKIKVRILFTMDKENLDFNLYPHLNYSRWFQTMYFNLLKTPMELIEENPTLYNYGLFLDKKDTHSRDDAKKLTENLIKKLHTFSQITYDVYDSKDIVLIQIADLFAGATSYKNRKLKNKYKLEIINLIEQSYNVKLNKSTKKYKLRFNIFEWKPEVKF